MADATDDVGARQLHEVAKSTPFKTAPDRLSGRCGGNAVAVTVPTAGWRETIDLPDWGIQGVAAKMDTGARSSCIDARDMEIMEGEEHGEVRFTVATPDGDVERTEPILDWRLVRDSGGHQALRPVIKVRMAMGNMAWEDEATLHDRSEMRHRVLVGRRVLAGRVIIDSSQSFLLTAPPQAETTGAGDTASV